MSPSFSIWPDQIMKAGNTATQIAAILAERLLPNIALEQK